MKRSLKAPKVLALDGGGLRGFFTLQLLKELEHRVQRPLHEVFDMIVGTSTGAIIAAAVGILKYPISEVELLYERFGKEVFAADTLLNQAVGYFKTAIQGVYYDVSKLEAILRERFPQHHLRDHQHSTPLVAMIASDSTQTPGNLFVFSTYTRQHMHFDGSNEFLVWKALRASTAAPFYFDVFSLKGAGETEERLFVDGGLIANNPSQVGYLEAKKIFNQHPTPIVVSVGTGRSMHAPKGEIKTQWWKTTLMATLETAMATHHTTLFMKTLLGDNFFRINGPVTYGQMDLYQHVESWKQEGQAVARSFAKWDTLINALIEM
jgi:patatin-like phospholipase/acyl hydrolase